jgi:Domain of unknown function (DUF4352)
MQLKPITVITVLMLVVASLLVSGCTTSTSDNNAQVGSIGNASAGNSAPQSGAMVVTANKMGTPDTPYYKSKTGYTFVTFNCSVTNVNSKDRTISLGNWKLRDSAGGVYGYSSATVASSLPYFDTIFNTQPGDIVKGIVIFEVPQNATLKSLTYDDSYQTKVTFPL